MKNTSNLMLQIVSESAISFLRVYVLFTFLNEGVSTSLWNIKLVIKG